jgi:hypothetical protein
LNCFESKARRNNCLRVRKKKGQAKAKEKARQKAIEPVYFSLFHPQNKTTIYKINHFHRLYLRRRGLLYFFVKAKTVPMGR